MDQKPLTIQELIMQTNESPDTNDQPAARKILCIEDEHFISELYTRALTKAGYDVTVELDGQKGLAAAQTDAYDIILLDLMVPTMTGIDILHALRDPQTTPRLRAKIIVATNLEQKQETRALIESQADGYIVKAEITPRELVEILDKVES
jgi:DNA-binding response OmpR family regulator